MLLKDLYEDSPRRLIDPSVIEWLNYARKRTDANELYVHGSPILFNKFKNPNKHNLIHFSKLLNRNNILQAEYYGFNLYLAKINSKKSFDPLNDVEAKQILENALHSSDVPVWDIENKIRYGRIDYQDIHLVIPPAVKAGYDFFKIYEISTQGYSYGCAYADMITIVDRLTE